MDRVVNMKSDFKINGHQSLMIGILGLGYVGLPLAVAFSKTRPVTGFDVSEKRVKELTVGIDSTGQFLTKELEELENLKVSCDSADLSELNCFIVTVPTPVDKNNVPNLDSLETATNLIAKYLKKGDLVIYESTVFPGATEEVCVPILEKVSGLEYNADFFCGYSPERLSPGDHGNDISKIVKVTSGSTDHVGKIVDALYDSIISAGTYLASSIKIAEAAKILENTQRDVNIALMNEAAILFDRLGIDTKDVLDAANTKWNFLPFFPGMVGGHCISVDPFYLIHKASQVGSPLDLVANARRINDDISNYITQKFSTIAAERELNVVGSKVLILGLTFKENCPDIRNSKVIDVYNNLVDLGCSVSVSDPKVDKDEVYSKLGIQLIAEPTIRSFEAVFLMVPHEFYRNLGPSGCTKFLLPEGIFFDIKSCFDKEYSDFRL